MNRPLDAIRVIDVSTGPVGGFATTVLADFGAEVLKIEKPGGDPFRSLPSWPLWLRGKHSIEIDLSQPPGRDRLHDLVRSADVLVSSFAPARAAHLGTDWETLSQLNPTLVHASITGFGPRGPYSEVPGYEGIVAVKTGRISAFEGQKTREGPTFAALPVASHAAAQGAVQGILSALFQREDSGLGSRVETSLAQATLPYDLGVVLIDQLVAREPEAYDGASGLQSQELPTLNYHPVQCRDGQWIQLGNLLEHLFLGFLDAVGLLAEFLQDERMGADPASWSPEAVELARYRILERMLERDADDWMKIFREHGGVAAEIWKPSREALDHPDLVGNGDVVELEQPGIGRIRQIGPIAALQRTPGRVDVPAPGVGQHTQQLAKETERPAPAFLHKEPGVRGRPLDGVCVIEIATIIAAPLGVSMLADLGARVIKVEPIDGDPFRQFGAEAFQGLFANRMNQGKESICLDLKSQRGQAIVADLVRGAHAVVHNYRPGVPERLGIGYETLRALRSDLVWVSVTGYGPGGPGAHRPATHPVAGASMGGSWFQAGAGMPPRDCADMEARVEAARQLIKANESNPDPNTSVIVASATLLALLAQRRFGIGQAVYVNMLASNAWANGDDMLSYPGKPDRPVVDADLFGISAGYRFYPARSGWVFLALAHEHEWQKFCRQVGHSEWLSDPRFETAASRSMNDEELRLQIEAALRERDADEWEQQMLAVGVACVKAGDRNPTDFLVGDSHSRENGFAPEVHHPRYGTFRRWSPLVMCDGGHDAYGRSPLAGEHTDALLEELGRSPEEIASLREAGVVSSEKLTA